MLYLKRTTPIPLGIDIRKKQGTFSCNRILYIRIKENQMKKLLVVFFVFLSYALFALPMHMGEELKLTADQKSKIEKIVSDNRVKIGEQKIAVEMKKLEIRKLMLKDDSLDKKILQKAYEEEAALNVALKMLRFEEMRQIYSVLTPEQAQKAKVYARRFLDKKKKGKGGMPMGHHAENPGMHDMMGFNNPGADGFMSPPELKKDIPDGKPPVKK
jgi:Spy/CpxP family protein refolding chaperone